MAARKEEIKENILAIWKIAILARKSYEYCYYLHKPETSDELEYLNNSREFKFIRHILWRNTVIELSKLFNSSPKRDKYNIFHFIKKLKGDQYFGGFGISQEKINGWEDQLQENDDLIGKILLLRDKVYGHTDGENTIKNLDTPTFSETEELLKIIEDVIKEIYYSIFDSEAMVDTSFVKEGPSNIIKVLSEERKSRLNDKYGFLKRNKETD
ncbi:MAG: AbiU2 domain-containing protein [Flagellimonas sp.]